MSLDLNIGEKVYGFKVQSIQEINDFRSISIHLIHEASGMEIWHLYNDDIENLFAFMIKTPPCNDKGIPHILEHCVLRGSKRVDNMSLSKLMRTGISTYLNGWTLPDKTVYIGSSINNKDFYNSLLFFGNAIFYPELNREIFVQEAFNPCNSKNFGGIVYNEILGKYYSGISFARKELIKSIFPDCCYRYDSGGVPKEIINLDVEEIRKYHKQWYHASNTKIFLSGNIPTKTHLKFLNENLSDILSLKKKDCENILAQSTWKKPRYNEGIFPSNNNFNKSNFLSIGWLTQPVRNTETIMNLKLLSYILLGSKDSILYKNLIKIKGIEGINRISGLDEDYIQAPYNIFLTCNNDISLKELDDVLEYTLREVYTNSVYQKDIMSALNRILLQNKEIRRFGGGPYTLYLMRKFMNGWSYGNSPNLILEANSLFDKFNINEFINKKSLASIIEKNFLSNNNKSTLLLRPDENYLEKEMKYITNTINKKNEKKNNECKVAELETNIKLKLEPLKYEDISKSIDNSKLKKFNINGDMPLYWSDIYTNGILYIDILFDISNLSNELMIYLPLWGKFMTSNISVPSEISSGFNYSLETGKSLSNNKKKSYCQFSIKILPENLEVAILALKNLLCNNNPLKEIELKKLIIEYNNSLMNGINSSKAEVAMRYLKSLFSDIYKRENDWYGIGQVLFAKKYYNSKSYDEELELLLSNLNKITKLVINTNNLIFNIVAEEKYFQDVYKQLEILTSNINMKKITFDSGNIILDTSVKEKNYLLTSTKVNYIAKGFKSSIIGSKDEVMEVIIAYILRNEFLWDKIRNKGGAYNVEVKNDNIEGIFTFMSCDDPKIEKTLSLFRESLIYANKIDISLSKLRETIISIIGREMIPMSPKGRGRNYLKREIYGITDEMLIDRRQKLLSINPRDIRSQAEVLLDNYDHGYEVVVMHRDYIEKVDKKRENFVYF